ncbi:copper transporter [Tsukamurella soli]|uniref:Copper transport outer membrane protein, MctB n=1 Tax=Tsukamurella soli TaxID=644556 RepID=A0ABP8JMN2_9ACTN
MPSLSPGSRRRADARRPALFWAAVLVALAVGLALGGGVLARYTGDGGVTRDLRAQVADLKADNQDLTARADAGEGFADTVAGRLFADGLSDSPVVVIAAPGADPADVSAITTYVERSGGTVTGTLTLTPTLYADGQAARLGGIVDQSVPAGVTLDPTVADPAARAGDLLGAILLSRGPTSDPAPAAPSGPDRANALAALRDGGFVTFDGGDPAPARVAVVVTGASVATSAAGQGQAVGRLAAALSKHGQGAVLAGRTGSAAGAGPVVVVRHDDTLHAKLSTVDDVGTAVGRVTAVLALGEAAHGRFGAYGTGPTASAVAPGVG